MSAQVADFVGLGSAQDAGERVTPPAVACMNQPVAIRACDVGDDWDVHRAGPSAEHSAAAGVGSKGAHRQARCDGSSVRHY